MSTATYSTKRSPAVSSSKRGAPATHLTGLASVPLMPAVPVGTGATNVLQMNMPIVGQVDELWETFIEYQAHTDGDDSVTQLPDIVEGDVLVAGGANYAIRRVNKWPATFGLLPYLHVVVEESK